MFLTRRTPRLSTREQQVLRLVAKGKHNSEIAQELFISEATVENHLHAIYRKMHVRGRIEAVMQGIATGFVPLEKI